MLFKKPAKLLQELKKQFNCTKVSQLKGYLRGAKQKMERESYHSALFAESLNKISKQEFIIRIPEKDDHRDYELLDLTQHEINKKLPKEKRVKYDHFLIQNVLITPEAVRTIIEQGEVNIYKIFTKHLERTKLSSRAGDYTGCILVFYFNLTINGLISLKELRSAIRSIDQENFQQIWAIVPNRDKYQIGELLRSNDLFRIADFSNE